MQTKTQWETVIGLEIHVQLQTKSKLFSGAATTYGAEPNVQACAIDLGLPGVLPVLNEAAVRMAIKFGVSIGATITPRSIFARKNYFYPDLPKGYQISQYELPIVSGGSVEFTLPDGSIKKVNITRAHLEEDAGKSLHADFQGASGIDLNRAGIPLIEIVSEPELRSAVEAVAYLKTIHALVRYLEISDGNMQEGSFRCDANVSVRPVGQAKLGTRAEIKNVNSFRFVEKAINFEIERQIELLEQAGTVVQETRLYDSDKDETRPMRTKEEANDYRYFPDPDLLPVVIEQTLIDEIRKALPELPREKASRFESAYGLSHYDAIVLTSSRDLADFFEATVRAANGEAKLCANWVMGELSAALNKENLSITESPISPEKLGMLVQRISDKTISGKIAKVIFEEMWNTGKEVDAIIDKKGLKQVTDTNAIDAIVDQILEESDQHQLYNYANGKEALFGFFVGQVMKASQGKANPQQVNSSLIKSLVPIKQIFSEIDNDEKILDPVNSEFINVNGDVMDMIEAKEPTNKLRENRTIIINRIMEKYYSTPKKLVKKNIIIVERVVNAQNKATMRPADQHLSNELHVFILEDSISVVNNYIEIYKEFHTTWIAGIIIDNIGIMEENCGLIESMDRYKESPELMDCIRKLRESIKVFNKLRDDAIK